MTFREGDLVFAKLKGFRHWPAKITNITTSKSNSYRFTILFFGDNSVSEVKESSLFPYIENISKYGILQSDNFKNKTFNKALQEAEHAYKISMTNKNDMPHCQSEESPKQDSLEDVEAKIQNIQDADLETSMTLAAEAGKALLIENNKLKQEIFELTLRNAQLAKRISETELTELKYESKLEELETNYLALKGRNDLLIEALNESERQLNQEKELRNELQHIFEEQDKEKEEIICKYENEIKQLQGIIRKDKTININQQINKTFISPTHKNAGTQTSNTETFTKDHSPTLALQLAQLKIRQDQLEHQMKSFKEQMRINDTSEQTKRTRATQSTPKNLTVGASQTSTKKLNTLTKTTQTRRRSQTHNSDARNVWTETSQTSVPAKRGRKYLFSVSLQVAKAKENYNRPELPSPANFVTKPIENHRMRLSNGPPMNSKLKAQNESYNDFFVKHFEFYKKYMNCTATTEHSHTTPPTNTPDLTVSRSQPLSPPFSPALKTKHQITVQAEVHQSEPFLDKTKRGNQQP